MIYAFNFTCPRDQDLSNLMVETLSKYAPSNLGTIRVVQTGGRKYTAYENGAGWNPSMMKLDELANLVEGYDIQNDDYILSVDSDVVFTSPEVFEHVDGSHELIGIQSQQPFITAFGSWGHMSGCLIFIRGDIARKMSDLSDEELALIRRDHFQRYKITENEDVVLSYLARYCGASSFDLPSHLTSNNFEEELKRKELRSFYHLNYVPKTFLGEVVAGKQDIPKVLKLKTIVL